MLKVLSIFGTRPEAIKMAPLLAELQADSSIESIVCVTAQHREMLDQVLSLFDIKADYDLNIMQQNQSLTDITSKMVTALEPVIKSCRPDLVLIHGDTSTAMCAALAAYYQQIPVGHLEAGLRTYDIYSSWPEEINRQIADLITVMHFAPTKVCADNLISENKNKSSIYVTGNTIIDALCQVRQRFQSDEKLVAKIKRQLDILDFTRKRVLITGHRRENFSDIKSVCSAIKILAAQHPDYDFVYSVHPNPNVKEPVYRHISNIENVKLLQPQDYLTFLYLMSGSYLILTDSGGIQEEAPIFDIPVLVMRDITERQEALDAGGLKLVGTNIDSIVNGVNTLLTDRHLYTKMGNAQNPYGDGTAAKQIVVAIKQFYNLS